MLLFSLVHFLLRIFSPFFTACLPDSLTMLISLLILLIFSQMISSLFADCNYLSFPNTDSPTSFFTVPFPMLISLLILLIVIPYYFPLLIPLNFRLFPLTVYSLFYSRLLLTCFCWFPLFFKIILHADFLAESYFTYCYYLPYRFTISLLIVIPYHFPMSIPFITIHFPFPSTVFPTCSHLMIPLIFSIFSYFRMLILLISSLLIFTCFCWFPVYTDFIYFYWFPLFLLLSSIFCCFPLFLLLSSFFLIFPLFLLRWFPVFC